MQEKKKPIWAKIPNAVWVLISFACAIALWLVASSQLPAVFAPPAEVGAAFVSKLESGILLEHVWASLSRVLIGFGLAFITSIPVAFLMAWYDPIRHIVEPWIQFVRNIPPLAYVFLLIAWLGIGNESKIAVIFIASFLVQVVTIYQASTGVDTTLIKAARVLGAKQTDIFFKVSIPATSALHPRGGAPRPVHLAHHAHGLRNRRRRPRPRHDDPAGQRLLPDGYGAARHHHARHHRHLL